MNSKINLCLVGQYLENAIVFENFKSNVNKIKKSLNQKVDTYIFTWNKVSDITKNKLKSVCDECYFFNEPDPLYIHNKIQNFNKKNKNIKLCENMIRQKTISKGGSFLNIYCMYLLRKYAIAHLYNKNADSYTFLLRIDMSIKFKRLKSWLSDDTYHVNKYRCFRLGDPKENMNWVHGPISDHCSIGTTKLLHKFYNMSNDEISQLFSVSHNAEESILNRLNQLKIKSIMHDNSDYDDLHLISSTNAYMQ